MLKLTEKINSAGNLQRIAGRLRSKGKKLVFTNGCFDILHGGHIDYLLRARSLGDMLVVGLNSDRSVRVLKGQGRPVNRQRDRAKVLASLYFVDYVTIFDSPTPAKLIKRLKPDVLVKGGDWKAGDIAGSGFVRERGGRVLSLPFVKGYSTTSLLRKIKKQ